jgi:hypothetical protein
LWSSRQEWNRYDEPGSPQPPPGTHRWTMDRAWIRIVPTSAATVHELTMLMGSPFPAPVSTPAVEVRVGGGAPLRFMLSPEVKAYSLRIETPPGRPVVVEIAAPTWCRAGEPADQGIRLDRVVLTPVP